MSIHGIAIHTGDVPDFERLLAERIYEYNAAATGYHDGESFMAVVEDESAGVDAGVYAYTWGGCCYVSYLWVSEPRRRRGVGSALLEAVERHAIEKGCRLVFLSSHSFQAPEFYRRRGYAELVRVHDHPPGHASIFFAKRLEPSGSSPGSDPAR